MKFKYIIQFYLILFSIYSFCYSAEILYVKATTEESFEEKYIEIACNFYGIDIERLSLSDTNRNILPMGSAKSDIKAIVISSRLLSILEKNQLFPNLNKIYAKTIPLLILGVTSDINSNEFSELAKGTLIKCVSTKSSLFKGTYRIDNLKSITRQLADAEISIVGNKINYFIFNVRKDFEKIISVRNIKEDISYPVFTKTTNNGQDIFFLAYNDYKKNNRKNDFILNLLPILMFLKYSSGQSSWHTPGHYSNLTIDDPWFTEPYGFLSYRDLLDQMRKSNFHTTIAFIPWNFDRGKLDIVSLFHNNPDRFSICIHGNNHDHQEFYKYKSKSTDPWQAKSLSVHEINIKQALARMEEYGRLTGLSYDKVMVFPHGIAPAETLGVLKRYNFIATVNADNVPLGSHEPQDLLFQLRPVTSRFENFPSLKRYEPKRNRVDIAIDLFLDSPLLFYAHHEFFEDGIDAFNETAEIVNSIQPDIIWQSLGYICQHLYLEKLRDDGQYDVLAFTSNFILENTHQHDMTYFIQKEESFSFPIKQVAVDGQPYFYEKSDKFLLLEIFIPAGESRHIVIEYDNTLDLSLIDISKNDPRVNRLRKLSDFRDITLSKNFFGRLVISVYYGTGLYKFGIVRLLALALVLFILMMLGVFYIIKLRKKHKA